MTNLQRYDKEFISLFKVSKEELPTLKYRGIKQWDSLAHMDLMSRFEELFDIQISTLDVLDFSSYEKGKEVLGRYGVEI